MQATPPRVFVVDDNRDAADTLAMLLQMEGYDVRVEYDGDDAIRAADEFHPDVALLDIGLPGKDGYEIARHIREDRGDDDVMLIAVTGYSSEEDVRRARAAGFDYHFGKPANLGAVLKTIEGRFGERPRAG